MGPDPFCAVGLGWTLLPIFLLAQINTQAVAISFTVSLSFLPPQNQPPCVWVPFLSSD